MRPLKFLLKLLAWLSLPLVLVAALLHDPALLLQPRWLAPFSEKAGVRWTGLQIEVTSHWSPFFGPEVEITWRGARIQREGLDVQTGPGDVKVEFNFLHPAHFIAALNKVAVEKAALTLIVSAEPKSRKSDETKKSPTSRGIFLPVFPKWLRKAKVGEVNLELSRWTSHSTGGDDGGSAYLRHGSSDQKWIFGGDERQHHLQAKIVAFKSPSGEVLLELEAQAAELVPAIRQVRTNSCQIRWSDANGDELKLHCPLDIALDPPAVQAVPNLRFQEKLRVTLSSKFKSRNIFDFRKPITTENELTLEPSDPAMGLGKVSGRVSANGKLILGEPASKWDIKSDFDVELEIDRFAHLVKLLDSTIYAVPAPFHALHGQLHLSANGKLEKVALPGVIPLKLESHLRSPHQKVDMKGEGTLSFAKSPAVLDFALSLEHVDLLLPHLDLAAPPQLLPDARIMRKQLARKSDGPPSFVFHLAIKTADDPLHIGTNLAQSPIPIRLDLKAGSDQDLTGTLKVETFPLDLFRRKAQVDHFNIDFEPKEKKIDGEFKIAYTDYTILIDAYGTTDKPDFKFGSDPPLSDSDVVSVLLFGKTSDSLDPTQTQSVGNTQSAAAAHGLDLASMYLLSSTPVESVGWDPQSGTFSAKFHLAEGTSLSVTKGQQEQQSVGIRKRIGSNWAITTQLGNPVDPTDHSLFALFEWSHRY